jgi:hypothetical protein
MREGKELLRFGRMDGWSRGLGLFVVAFPCCHDVFACKLAENDESNTCSYERDRVQICFSALGFDGGGMRLSGLAAASLLGSPGFQLSEQVAVLVIILLLLLVMMAVVGTRWDVVEPEQTFGLKIIGMAP